MSSPIFRNGISIGANTREAQNTESKRDFIHKFKITAKEADEVEYRLKLCKISEFYPDPDEKMFDDLTVIIKILSKIISTSKGYLINYQIY